MKIKTKIDITPLLFARLVIMAAVSLILIGLLFFLYRDFYQTISQAETVIVLKREVALKDIEMELFKRVKYVNDRKITNILPAHIVDVFSASGPIASPPPAPAATTTPPLLNNY